MQPLKQTLFTGYTVKETVCAYLVTGWFSFGAFLAYITFLQPLGKYPLPELFYLILLSLVMVGVFPLGLLIWNGTNAVVALARQDYLHALFSFAMMLGLFFAWFVIRYVLYGRPRRWTVSAP